MLGLVSILLGVTAWKPNEKYLKIIGFVLEIFKFETFLLVFIDLPGKTKKFYTIFFQITFIFYYKWLVF